MVMEGDFTWCGEHHAIFRWCIIECIPETYIILLTNITPIHLIKLYEQILIEWEIHIYFSSYSMIPVQYDFH